MCIYLSICLSTCLPVCLSICLFIYLSLPILSYCRSSRLWNWQISSCNVCFIGGLNPTCPPLNVNIDLENPLIICSLFFRTETIGYLTSMLLYPRVTAIFRWTMMNFDNSYVWGFSWDSSWNNWDVFFSPAFGIIGCPPVN